MTLFSKMRDNANLLITKFGIAWSNRINGKVQRKTKNAVSSYFPSYQDLKFQPSVLMR